MDESTNTNEFSISTLPKDPHRWAKMAAEHPELHCPIVDAPQDEPKKNRYVVHVDESCSTFDDFTIRPAPQKNGLSQNVSLASPPYINSIYQQEEKPYTYNDFRSVAFLNNYNLSVNNYLLNSFFVCQPPRQEVEELKPMEIANRFSELTKSFFVGDRMYAYNGVYFKHHNRLDTLRLIAQMFHQEVYAKGKPSFVKEIYESLLIAPKIQYEFFPPDDPAIAFQNCTFSLEDRMVHAHSPMWKISYGITCNYRPESLSCPRFDQFLFEASCGNEAWMDRVYEVIGHLITPHRGKSKFFVFQGVPNSGKSMLAEFILSLFNYEATITMRLERLSSPFSISELQDKAIWMAPEKSSKPLDPDTIALMKTLVGGDRITAEEKNKQMVRFINKAKPLIVTNYPLLPKVYDEAFYQRAVTIPFQYAVPSGREDPSLPEKFATEKDAIVTKALHKYLEMLDSGRSFSGEFALNEVVMDMQGCSSETSVEGMVYQFVQSYLVEAEQSGIFAEDALSCFLTQIGSINENSFSKLFKKYVLEVYGIVQKRERKPGQKNPQSFYPGLKLKESTFALSTN